MDPSVPRTFLQTAANLSRSLPANPPPGFRCLVMNPDRNTRIGGS